MDNKGIIMKKNLGEPVTNIVVPSPAIIMIFQRRGLYKQYGNINSLDRTTYKIKEVVKESL